jgi:hypothetical protein
MFISHFHDPEDGFPNLEDMYDDGNSISSILKKSPIQEPDASLDARISAAVRRVIPFCYLMLTLLRISSI